MTRDQHLALRKLTQTQEEVLTSYHWQKRDGLWHHASAPRVSARGFQLCEALAFTLAEPLRYAYTSDTSRSVSR